MSATSVTLLRVVLLLSGLFIAIQGVNIIGGGMRTLGWLGESDFLTITDLTSFQVQDSHARFLGGLWLGIGLLFCVAASNVRRYAGQLRYAFVLVILGGLARFAQMDMAVTFGDKTLGSLIAELVGMPILWYWLSKAVRSR